MNQEKSDKQHCAMDESEIRAVNFEKFKRNRQVNCRLKKTNHKCTSNCTYRSPFSHKEHQILPCTSKYLKFIVTIWGSTPDCGRALGPLNYGRKT